MNLISSIIIPIATYNIYFQDMYKFCFNQDVAFQTWQLVVRVHACISDTYMHIAILLGVCDIECINWTVNISNMYAGISFH